METEMVPFVGRIFQADWKYIQNKSPIHASGKAMKFILYNSPDLNIMLNMYSCLVRVVLKDSRYSSTNILKKLTPKWLLDFVDEDR